MGKWRWKFISTVPRGFSWDHRCELRVLLIALRVKVTSSVNSINGSNWRLVCNQWQNSTRMALFPGCIFFTGCGWNGYKPSSYNVRHTRVPETPIRAESFMFLWPCIVSKAWGKKTNKMQQYRWFIVNSGCWLLTLSHHVSGIFMPIFRRKTLFTACGVYFLVVLDVAVCGTVVLCWGCDHSRTATFTVITPSTQHHSTANCHIQHYQQIHSTCSNTWSFSWRWA